MKKINSVLLIMMMAFSALTVAIIPLSAGSSTMSLPDYEPLDIGDSIRSAHYEINGDMPLMSAQSSSGPMSAGDVGDVVWFLALDSYEGYYFWAEFELRAAGDIAEVWVQLNLSYPAEDPRDYPDITDDQVTYLLGEFENNIYEKDTSVFGTPDFHDGSGNPWGDPDFYNEHGKNIIMVSNVRDDAYYNSSYPYYIAGFYSPSFEYYIDRNIITIDSHDWANRMGEDVARPFLYESIIAHEYQHLIHDDYNPDDETFMNEACSLYAEPMCGYPIDWGQVNRFLETPDNSLTVWGDQGDLNILADYGSSFLWSMYLGDHYGGDDFIGHFVQAGIPGVAGINAALKRFHYKVDFDDVYHDWRIANLVNAEKGKYGYTSLDLSDAENTLRVYNAGTGPFEWTKGTDFGTSVSYDGDDTGIAMIGPYGTDYIKYTNEDLGKTWDRLYFDGDDDGYVPVIDEGWEMTDFGWYSGASDLLNTVIFGEAFVNSTDPTLYITTYWDIEDYWDFGFVQVSTNDGATWTSIGNDNTTYGFDPDGHPDIEAYLPGLTVWSGGWVEISFDLSDYKDQNVLIGFRYMTDWAFTYEGWYILEANVGGIALELEKFVPIPTPYPADFMVSVVTVEERAGGNRYIVTDVSLSDVTNFGSKRLRPDLGDYFFIIVSPLFEKGLLDYSFKVVSHQPGRYRVK